MRHWSSSILVNGSTYVRVDGVDVEMDKYMKRIAELEAVLAWYADQENYAWGPGDSESSTHLDQGRRARKALGKETQDDIENAKYD